MLIPLLTGGCTCECAKRHQPPIPPKACFRDEMTMEAGNRKIPVMVTRSDGHLPVLLLHEIGGQSPAILELARKLEKRGAVVYVPRFFGSYGGHHPRWHIIRLALHRSGRFRGWNADDIGPVRREVSDLVGEIVSRHPGERIAVIGNCLTGALPLEVLARKEVGWAVMCQPTVPFRGSSENFGIPRNTIDGSLRALEKDEWKKLISFHYASDSTAPVCRTYAIAAKTKGIRAGGKHRIHVGIPPGGLPSEAPAASHPGWSPLQVRDGDGHSTITAPHIQDREVFFEALCTDLGLSQKPSAESSAALKTEGFPTVIVPYADSVLSLGKSFAAHLMAASACGAAHPFPHLPTPHL